MVRQKFAGSHQDPLAKLDEAVSQEASVQNAIKMTHAPRASSAAAGGQARTLASPQWDNDPPINWRKTLPLTPVSIADFDANNTFLCRHL